MLVATIILEPAGRCSSYSPHLRESVAPDHPGCFIPAFGAKCKAMAARNYKANSGLYVAVFHVAKTQHIRVGKLGRFSFRKGLYFYVGSGRKNLDARLKRHVLKKKLLRWHIDYLSVRAKMIGAIVITESRESECKIARKLAGSCDLAVAGFGSSDCCCPGHLFYGPEPI